MEEILKLMIQMQQAKGGNKNLSGLLGNMDNPLLLALAGVLDPMSMQDAGQASSLYGQYAGDPNTPDAVKVLMDYVDQGANKYQIESAINQLDPNVVNASGYTDDQLISMGVDMVKQRSEGTDKNVFEKAGFRNPNDVYTASDVPLSANSQKRLMELQVEYESTSNKMARQETRTGIAAKKMRGFSEESKKGLAGKLKSEYKGIPVGPAQRGLREFEEYVSSSPYLTVEELNKKFDSLANNLRGANPQEVDRFKRAALARIGSVSKNANQASEVKSMDRGQTIRDWEQSKIEESKIKAQESNILRLREAIVQANLQQAAQTGRTPFTDQASQLTKFIAGMK